MCLIVSAFTIYLRPVEQRYEESVSLSEAFSSIDGWKLVDDILMDQNIVDSLDLDDYLFGIYSNGKEVISLYIGYYRYATKVGSAHSPLVCYPGQGWKISIPKKIFISHDGLTVNAQKLIASKKQEKELLLYWYQSYNTTSSGTFGQKIQTFWARLNSEPTINAFVRLSIPIHYDDTEAAYKIGKTFIKAFYPLFVEYNSQQIT